MGNKTPECCQQALENDINDLRAQTSNSLALIEKLKQEQKEIDCMKSRKNKYCTLKLQTIHSSKSINHGLENKKNVLFEIPASIKINESWTTSADHKLEEAVSPESVKYNDVIDSGLEFNELYRKTTLIKPFRSTSTEKGYDSENNDNEQSQDVPMPIAINWSISNNSNSNRTRIEYMSPSTTVNSGNLNYYAAMTTSPISVEETEDIPISPLTLSPTPDTKDNEYLMQIDDKCISIESCPSIKCIINALQWYSIYGVDHDNVYKKMKINNYGEQIMNDYNHILDHHLNDENMNNSYHLILIEIIKYVEPCSFIECDGHQRYLRSRNEKVHKAQNGHQHDVQMYVNTMDGIHSCFMHLAKKL